MVERVRVDLGLEAEYSTAVVHRVACGGGPLDHERTTIKINLYGTNLAALCSLPSNTVALGYPEIDRAISLHLQITRSKFEL